VPDSLVRKEATRVSERDDDRRKAQDNSGLFIPAGLFIGIGLGWALGLLVQGLFIGLGVGFLVMALVRMKYNK